jgi:hypothetical protein
MNLHTNGSRKPNQTIIELEDSHKVNHELVELIANLEKLPRIRHVIKNQRITVSLCKKNERVDFPLKYSEPDNPLQTWSFTVPSELCNGETQKPVLKLRYFQKPLEDNFNPIERSVNEVEDDDERPIYREPIDGDPSELLIRGRWVKTQAPVEPGPHPNPNPNPNPRTPQFIPDEEGTDLAVQVGSKHFRLAEGKKTREGLRVLMSDDSSIPDEDRRIFGEFDDPVDDRDMVSKGIVWINANHPTIVERRTKSENDPVFLEMVANYVLMVVAQFHAQKHYDAEPADEKSDPILLFRQKFFKFQRELRQDNEITYFDSEAIEEEKTNSTNIKIADKMPGISEISEFI